MRTPKKGRSSLKILLADPGVRRFDVFSLRQINKDHHIEVRTERLLNGFIIPSHPENLFFFWEDEVPEIVDGQQKAFPGGVIDGLCSVANIRWVKRGKSVPMERVNHRSLTRLLLHDTPLFLFQTIILELNSVFNG